MTKETSRLESMLNEVQSHLAKLKLDMGAKSWSVRVLEPAQVLLKPTKPEKLKVFALAIVAGFMLGFGGAWVREKTDHRLSSADEIAQILGLPVLSIIPSMPGRSGAVARGQKIHLESMSDVAEAFRTLRTVVYFSVPEGKAKTILLTSPFQGEGKSTTASGLAIAMAKAGRRTLMIDGDLRKPTLHRIFELSDAVGLSSVMAGRESLEKAIQRTAVEGLDVLPCGPIPANPSEILNSKAFAEMLQKLSQRYDHIVLDSPPVLPVTDARILGATCDVTLLVLRANRSTRRMSEYAAEAMLGVGARVLGVVVNDVPRSKRTGYHGGYGYGNYGYGKRNYEMASQQQKQLPTAARTAETPAA
jgi:capsular exopolysaccharide synthesis family protein